MVVTTDDDDGWIIETRAFNFVIFFFSNGFGMNEYE